MSSPQDKELAMPAAFPHRYQVNLEGEHEGAGRLRSASRSDIECGAPPEFDGDERWWSPEHLLLGSLSLCLMTTFRAFAARKGLQILGYRGRAEGILDRTPTGLAFTSLTLFVDLRVPMGDLSQAEALLRSAKKHCIVGNCLNLPVGLEISVIASEPAIAAAS
jgi:organic hydroperoxide reductase OsmC/OhrA